MSDRSNHQNRNLKNEMVILSSLSLLSIGVGLFLLFQDKFGFWMTKPIGIFCLLFPIFSVLYYLRLQFFAELEKSKFLDRILTVNPATVLLYDWKTKDTYVLNGIIPSLGYSGEELYSLQHNLFSGICENTSLSKVMTDLQKAAVLEEDQITSSEWTLRTKMGEARPFEVKLSKMNYRNSEMYILAFIEDVFEKKSLNSTLEKNKQRMAEMEKFAVLKNLGSGVAHEIANPLASIKGRTQILKSRILQGKLDQEQIIDGLNKVEHSADRINNTIQALRQLTKDNSKEKLEQHPVYTLFENIEMVWGQRLRTHGFEFEIPKINIDLAVTCRKSQIETAIFNLISNSFEHLQEKENKWIKVEASEIQDNILISVTDSGHGIPSNIRSKIFDPFYSATPDKNTGLGLSITRGIIQAHGGTIELDMTSPNTRFVIKLPKSQSAQRVEAA